MMSATNEESRYYLAINGQPAGPYSAAMVTNMWRKGTVSGETLICAEGGPQWLPLLQFEGGRLKPGLPANLPPLPPEIPGELGPAAPASRRSMAVPNTWSVEAPPADKTRGLRLSTLFAAAICFFLPWLEFSCAGKPMLRQSGWETITGQMTPDPLLEDAKKEHGASFPEDDPSSFGKEVGHSWGAGAALLLTVFALSVAFQASGKALSGMLAGMALTCLLIPALGGFPLEDAMKKRPPSNSGFPTASRQASEEMAGGFAEAVFKVTYTPWLYVEFAALGLCVILSLAGRGGRQA